MKKQISLLLAICLTTSLIGCGRFSKKPPQPTEDNATVETQNTPNINQPQIDTDTSMVAVSVPTVTVNTLGEDSAVLCQYTYQTMSMVHSNPDVADKIIIDFLNRVDSTSASANAIADMAKAVYNGNKNWVPYLYHITYSPTRIDHRVLSMFGNNVVFSGAGHPERTCVSASYDLRTGDVLTLAGIMSKDASTDAFYQLVLDGLSEMAEGDYLYENYAQTVKQRFSQDATQDEAWYFTQTGLCFYFAPYEIAPYSSGVISVEIPYEKLQTLLHESFLPLARTTAEGKVTVSPFETVDLQNFSHIAEFVADKDGKMYMLHTDAAVQDVRLLLSDNASSYTVFATYHLMPGDGIMVQGSEELLQRMKLTYKTDKETVTVPLFG